MGYDVSALPAYTKQDANKLIYENLFKKIPILESYSAPIQTGVKSSDTINIVSTSPVWQTQGCSLNPSGTTTFTRRTITVGKPKIDMSWCERDLEPYYFQEKMKQGGNYDSLTYNEQIIGYTMDDTAKKMATAIWQGDTTSWSAWLNKFDGLVKTLDADIPAANTYSGTAWSQTNSMTVIEGIVALIVANQDVYQGCASTIKLFMNPQMAFQYRMKLINANLFHVSGLDSKLYAHGTNIEIIEDPGLTGVTKIYAIEPENIRPGTDMENEQEKYDLWFSKDDQKLYFHTEWKFGINVAFEGRCFNYLGV